jgi:hypothetical protein
MRRLLFLCMALGLSAVMWADPSITLQNIKGKVEVKAMGKEWAPASEGMAVSRLDTISTGFDSGATLMVADNKIRIGELTRLSVDKIVSKPASTETALHLRVGNVSAEVKSSAGVSQKFKVTTPYSTASVRGTGFYFDGFHLRVTEGRVLFSPGRPQRAVSLPGADLSLLELLRAASPADSFTAESLDGESIGGDTPQPELPGFMVDKNEDSSLPNVNNSLPQPVSAEPGAQSGTITATWGD